MRTYEIVVYMAKNKNNGKIYIGCSSYGLAVRKAAHKKNAKEGKQSPFHDAIRKEGFEVFEWEVLKVFKTKEEANDYEKFLIKAYGYRKLYNTHLGNEKHKHNVPRETRIRLAESKLGEKNPRYGKKMTQEEKEFLLNASKEVCCKKVVRIVDGQKYESISDCARQNNKSIATISLHVNKKVKNPLFKFK